MQMRRSGGSVKIRKMALLATLNWRKCKKANPKSRDIPTFRF